MFITLEGIEGCGKSTQARRLAAWLDLDDVVVGSRGDLSEPLGHALGGALGR